MANVQNEKVEEKLVQSFKDLQFDGAAYDGLDLEEDAWSYGAPPPAGVYDFKWFLAKDGLKVGFSKKDDPTTAYIKVSLEGKLKNNAEWEDTTVYAYLDSRIFKGKKTSTMAGFLVKVLGVEQMRKLGPLNAKKMGTVMEQILRKEPNVRAEIDWKGSYKYTDNKGVELYHNVANHYSEFPNDGEGGKEHMFTLPADKSKDGNPHDIRAMINTTRFLGKGESAPSQVVKSVVSNVAQPIQVELEPVMVSPTIAPASKVNPPVVAAPQQEEEDLALMLDV